MYVLHFVHHGLLILLNNAWAHSLMFSNSLISSNDCVLGQGILLSSRPHALHVQDYKFFETMQHTHYCFLRPFPVQILRRWFPWKAESDGKVLKANLLGTDFRFGSVQGGEAVECVKCPSSGAECQGIHLMTLFHLFNS